MKKNKKKPTKKAVKVEGGRSIVIHGDSLYKTERMRRIDSTALVARRAGAVVKRGAPHGLPLLIHPPAAMMPSDWTILLLCSLLV